MEYNRYTFILGSVWGRSNTLAHHFATHSSSNAHGFATDITMYTSWECKC